MLKFLPVRSLAIQLGSQVLDQDLHRLHCRMVAGCLPGTAVEEVRQYSRREAAASRDEAHEEFRAHVRSL